MTVTEFAHWRSPLQAYAVILCAYEHPFPSQPGYGQDQVQTQAPQFG